MQATEAINNIEGKNINEDKISRYKDDLNNYLMISVASPYALNTEFNLMGFKEESTSICYNKALCLRHANMFRHYLVGTPGINYTKALFDNKTNLYDRSIPLDTEEKDILFYLAPCYFRYDKANLMAIFKCLSNKCGNRIEKMQNNIHEDTEKLYNDINYKWRKLFHEKENYSDSMIKVGGTEADNKWMYFEVEDRYWEGHVNKRIAIANMKVSDKQVEQSMLKKPNLSTERCKTLFSIINEAVKDKCDILVLPELSVPHQWLDLLVGQSKKHQMAIIAGVEYYHDNDGYVYNCVATILPFRMRNGRTAAINIRIKNHYSPHERKVLEGYRYKIPSSKLYCLFHWRKVFFSVYNCFELADINDRSLFKAKVDFIVATELNRDVNYFADIAGSWVRDIHCFFIQVNTSHFGDSCIMQPSKSETCKMVSVKGGKNSTILVEDLEIDRLRSFQLKEHITQMDDSTYKLTPPDFSRIDVIRRINDDNIECFRGDSADKF